jgi:hypothetical protein
MTWASAWVSCLPLGLLLGCRAEHAEPPPAPEKYEIAPAPPAALGAHAAGIAHPSADNDEANDSDEAGVEGDAGAVAPAPSDGGIAL